jgi:hypothetical protein
MNKHQCNNQIISILTDYNDGKLIKEGKLWSLVRSREGDPKYLLTSQRGNFFKAFEITYLYEGRFINAFWFSGDATKVVIEKKLILKIPKSKPKEFMQKLVALTTYMGWFDSIQQDILDNLGEQP